MNCKLCKKSIENYNPEFNQLKIDGSHNVNICLDCINKFMKWQQETYAKLFPTKIAKKYLERINKKIIS